ncbi:hypothetical protein KA996_08680 [bacterium]|nr:hypothetical protein [bacterium]
MQRISKDLGHVRLTNRAAQVRGYYDELLSRNRIEEVAAELMPDRRTGQSGNIETYDCRHHDSKSGRSLQVDALRQLFICHGCNVGGNALHLVEFDRTGSATTGARGTMPESHVEARNYLADRCGMHRLGNINLTPEEAEAVERERALEVKVKEIFTLATDHYSKTLLGNGKQLRFLQENYNIGPLEIERFKIGFADPGEDLHEDIVEKGYAEDEILASGLFLKLSDGKIVPFYVGRIVFPYVLRGQIVYMTGRKTDETPDKPWDAGKYKKLPVHNSDKNSHIPEFMNGDTVYNEDALANRDKHIVIAEGITDAIAVVKNGFTAVGLGTVHVKDKIFSRFAAKLKRFDTVFISFDSEDSNVGSDNALKLGHKLQEAGVSVKIVILPRNEEEEKVDINSFFLNGHSPDDFQNLLDTAKTPLEIEISKLPKQVVSPKDRMATINVLKRVALLPPMLQDEYLEKIVDHTGKSVKKAALKSELKAAALEKQKEGAHVSLPDLSDISCSEAIDNSLQAQESGSKEEKAGCAGRAAYNWFSYNGAKFYNSGGEITMIFENENYILNSSDKSEKLKFETLMHHHTGALSASNSGKCLLQAFTHMAFENAAVVENCSWFYMDRRKNTVYLNLCNSEREIIKISPEEITIIPNGENDDHILLATSSKIKPLKYLPETTIAEGFEIYQKLVLNNLACCDNDKVFLGIWNLSYTLIGLCGTTALVRHTGSTSSGKTTGAKLFTTVIYGQPEQKIATIASNYADGAKNPLITLDNIESADLTTSLKNFFLTAGSEITKEKRKLGTDTENVSERIKTLIVTTGIEVCGSNFSELENRTLTFPFHQKYQKDPSFVESRIITKIQDSRDLIFSFTVKMTQEVLKMVSSGKMEMVMTLINTAFPNHSKKRLNEHLSLMYLISLAAETEVNINKYTMELHSVFKEKLETFHKESQETSRDSNQIVRAIEALFNKWQISSDQDNREAPFLKTDQFKERYQVYCSIDDGHITLKNVKAGELFLALKNIAADFRLPFEYGSSKVLVNRIENDNSIIAEAGIEIRSDARNSSNQKLYTITKKLR